MPPKKHTFNVTAQRSGKTVLLVLSGYIYPGGDRNSSAAVTEKLNELKPEDQLQVLVRNLYGGSVMEGLTIYHDLVALKPEVMIDGVAASMGAIIPLAGKSVKMSKHSKLMLHRVNAGSYGDPDQMEEAAKQAREWEDELTAILAERTGLTVEQVREKYMQTGKDVWLTAEQAKTAKLVDEVVKGSLRTTVPAEQLTEDQAPEDILERFAACLETEETTSSIPSAMLNFFKKKPSVPEVPKASAIDALKDVKAEDLTPEAVNAATAELQAAGQNVFVVPCTDTVKNASDLQEVLNKAENDLAEANKTIAKLKGKTPDTGAPEEPVVENSPAPGAELTAEQKEQKELDAAVAAQAHNKTADRFHDAV